MARSTLYIIKLDAPIVQKSLQPIPMIQCVADSLGSRPSGRQFRELRLEPDAQFGDQRLALELTRSSSISGGLASDIRLDRIECGYPLQRLDRDRRFALARS
jgi:hypothetical protein